MRGSASAVLLMAGLLITGNGAAAVFQPRDFATEQEALRYQALTEELRCLVCQNQSLADSNAELATDLRERIYTMISNGASDDEIVDFMVDRYGNFVLYRPPLTRSTLLLWFGPFALAFIGVLLLVIRIRRRNDRLHRTPSLSEAEQARVAALLQDTANENEAQR